MQTHAFLRSICRHLHFVRNHTKTHTFKHNVVQFSWQFVKFVCFYTVLFALQKRRYLRWFRALKENHTICNNLSCLGGLLAGLGWLGWVGWVMLAGFAGGLFGCLTTCSTFCMAVFLSGAALIRQFFLALLFQGSALDSHRFPETCLQPTRHWANLFDKLCLCMTLAALWPAFSCKQFYTSAVGTSMAK